MTIQKLKQYKIFKNEILLSLKLLKNQGYCNINYKLKTSKKIYLIRKFISDETVNINRKFEFTVQKKAYKKDIAGKPLFLDKDKNFMVCEFLKGKHKESLNAQEIKHLAKMVKKLHSIKSNVNPYDFKKPLNYYKKNLNTKEARKSISICKQELKILKKYKKTLVTTHHDLNPRNILFHKNCIKFIDWEYAGVNDSFFDLATLCFEFTLNKKEEKILLKSYQKRTNKMDIQKLHSYIKIYKNICKLWFMDLENAK
ncbi:Choline/ethanolamine kinase [Arcobacter nitrofigilis DSM 7299]|uniref:Choline/ethanolamine kinase n=1 Tax=Arcobacter nitrofigilis (strain ATCC 33309 / DSM 7299 / CCUG 15893 / LMG 7604 / NCTC 12251 / CI) TaxID=572480 RepID=D5V059_ARCNC|nr:choline kinase family protein [Arcobacter nitrofigilis]ADG93671.1 Choline/ethanolamine kinase [Arcobacter nitrofigilis DSM 7299]